MTESRTDWQARIRMAQQILEERLEEEVPIEELAAAVHSSPYHFHRIFSGITGETVRGYARRLRLERAAHRLVTDGKNDILAVALDAGYDSHEAFSRAFKRHFGTTPSAFRAAGKDHLFKRGESAMPEPLEVRIERLETKRIAFVRHVGPYDQVGEAWGKLMKWGWSKMLFGKAETFGLCFDDPEVTPSDRLRYEACMVVGERAKPKGDVQIKSLPATTYAFTVYRGPLTSINECYGKLFAHVACEPIEGRRRQLGDPPCLERYLRDPRKVKPEEMITEILVPVVE